MYKRVDQDMHSTCMLQTRHICYDVTCGKNYKNVCLICNSYDFFLYIWWIKDLFLRLFIVDLICVRYKRRNGWRTTVVLMDFVDLFKIEISSSTIIFLLWSVTSMTKGSGVNIINTQYASFLTSTVCDQKYFRCKNIRGHLWHR